MQAQHPEQLLAGFGLVFGVGFVQLQAAQERFRRQQKSQNPEFSGRGECPS